MTWLQLLYETYEHCLNRPLEGGEPLMPICHTKQKAHIEVILNGRGEFRRALVVQPNDAATLMPATEASAGRTGTKPVHHPLCDKLQYVAGDFVAYGGSVTSGFNRDPEEPHREFVRSLREWAGSKFTHPKVDAILTYVERGQLIKDLVRDKVLHVGRDGRLLSHWAGEKAAAPPLFRTLGHVSQHESLVRWRVEGEIGEPVTATWVDQSIIRSWIDYSRSQEMSAGLCMVTGEQGSLAGQHPKRLRHGGDQAKLISSDDKTGYTYRGRFTNADEAASVGFEVTQKAHNALRWLIDRQAYRDGDQVFLAWSPNGAKVPAPTASTKALFDEDEDAQSDAMDTAEGYALRLRRKMAGYRAELDRRDDVVAMGLDSATPGRLSITYYRKLLGSEFIDRVETWHRQFAWYQNLGRRDGRFIGAPAPRLIAETAFGPRADEKLRRATVERVLPCIIEGIPVPRDLVQSAVRRASNRFALDHWDWEKALGVACALFRGHYVERNYQMALETDRTTRDYLYGRLLAVADNIEGYALNIGMENRSTNAERLMQRFADHPYTTWRTIELSLRPYIARLRSSRPGFLRTREVVLQDIKDAFKLEDFTNDNPLSGEFLLSFDVQRRSLFNRTTSDDGLSNPNDLPAN